MDNIGGDVGAQRNSNLSSLTETLSGKIEACRESAKTKLNELIHEYGNSDTELFTGKIYALKKLAPWVTCDRRRLNEIKLENRQVICGSSDISENRGKENQDNYYELRDMLSKIDWNSYNWRMHISEFKKLDREVIRRALSCGKSISSLERMFLHYVGLEQTLEQNMRMESIYDTIDDVSFFSEKSK